MKKIIAAAFLPVNIDILSVEPFGGGLINDSYKVATSGTTDYVLQRINNRIFTDVDMLQRNIETVTDHLRGKNQLTLQFLKTAEGKTYTKVGDDHWRMSVFIPRSRSLNEVTLSSARAAGEAFGRFESMLADLPVELSEVIPDFHNIEFRLKQLREAVRADKVGRLNGVLDLVDQIERRTEAMCLAERLHRAGELPKRVCHCDTKVNNMLFDGRTGEFLCVVDLDTVMPSYVFSDYGDFLRTGACTAAEDEPNLEKVKFDMDIFRAFTDGYLGGAGDFLTSVEIEHLPYGAALFPYMQAVRFLADWLAGDTYYKIAYPEHNLVRTRTQLKLLESVEANMDEMRAYIEKSSNR